MSRYSPVIMQLPSSTWYLASKTVHGVGLRILSIAIEKELKVLA